VAGGGERLEGQAPEIDLFLVGQSAVGERAAAGRRREHLRPVRGQLHAAGHEVGVQVGLGAEDHPQAAGRGGGLDRTQVAAGVDGQCPSVAEVDQVGGVAQADIDQGDDGDVAHRVLHQFPLVGCRKIDNATLIQ
jgi:hypothetical protein